MSDPTPPLIDPPTLDTLASLGQRRGRDLLGRLYDLFKSQGPSAFADLRDALARGDDDRVADTAHSLKGSYQSLGLPRLAQLAGRLESEARENRLEDPTGQVTDIEEAFRRTDEALAAHLGNR